MPTGYTYKLMEEGQSFQEFAMGCARAFGACLEMRDDPQDAPIPEEFKPDPYYERCLNANIEDRDALLKMSEKEQIAYGERRRNEEIKGELEYYAKCQSENERLSKMLEIVKAWEPPTKDHENFKKFMLEQIEISFHEVDHCLRNVEQWKSRDAMGIYKEALDHAIWRVGSSEQSLNQEIERKNNNTGWVRSLRESLKSHQ